MYSFSLSSHDTVKCNTLWLLHGQKFGACTCGTVAQKKPTCCIQEANLQSYRRQKNQATFCREDKELASLKKKKQEHFANFYWALLDW